MKQFFFNNKKDSFCYNFFTFTISYIYIYIYIYISQFLKFHHNFNIFLTDFNNLHCFFKISIDK